ncbi:hypothetical protein Bca52824_084063 [Brassica carinata]|uniref:Uncharacterized protein n=1 Tax=Brassica carinata TaxID=52824 RepID=A0A8X7PMW7_BRACI|nr:hypothetical protein Bca52824_084063 [Brassica carinata]
MSKRLFLHIVEAVKQHDNYFTQRCIASGRMSLSTLQKVTAAFRILAYGMPADATDEYIKIGESIAIECMKRFYRAIIEVFSERREMILGRQLPTIWEYNNLVTVPPF